MGNCNGSSSSSNNRMSIPEVLTNVKDRLDCLEHRFKVLCSQIHDLKKRDHFIWCKLQEEMGNIDDLQTLTDFIEDECGVLSLTCDSGSGSASASDSESAS